MFEAKETSTQLWKMLSYVNKCLKITMNRRQLRIIGMDYLTKSQRMRTVM